MIATILGALFDSVLKAAFGWLSAMLEKRQLIAQGKAQQYTADLQATVKESTDAAAIRNKVASEPISSVDRDLEQLRQPSSPRDR